jgi:hypothetical protein
VVAVAVTTLRVGAAALRVGQAFRAFVILTLGACSSPPPRPAASGAPDLVIPRLDRDAGPATQAEGAHFGHPPATVGAAWTVELSATSRSADGTSAEQVSRYESTYRVEVLAVEGPAPSRVKLRFLRNVHAYQGEPAPTVIDGKEYVVDARAPHVRDSSGTAAPPLETERVLDIFPDLGTRSRVDEVLPDDALPVGARYDDLAAAILRVMHPRAWKLSAGTATLIRLDGAHAVFEIVLDAMSETGVRMEVGGQARVRMRDARLSELVLEGRYERKEPTPVWPGSFQLRRTVTSEGEARSDR